MEKRRILYRMGGSGRDQWMYELSQELEKLLSHESYYQCTNFGIGYIKQKAKSENILFMDEENNIAKPDIKYLQDMEDKYQFNIWDQIEHVALRRARERKIPTEKLLIRYEQIIRMVNNFLDENKITDYINYGPCSAGDVIFFRIMEQRGINIIGLRESALKKRFAVSADLSNNIYQLKEKYQELVNNGLTNNEKIQASDIVEKFKNKKYNPGVVVKVKKSKINEIMRLSKAAFKMIKHKQLPSTFRPFFWKFIQKSYDFLGIFEEPIEGEKFIFYPLHFQPEASTLIYGKWYYNQLNLIENLMRAMPVGYKLYVKEHKVGYGNRSLKFYKDIKKLAGVRLLTPHLDSHKLIKDSSLIVTITGTAGWESILSQKPVIIFGDTFYDVFNNIKKIKNIRDLPKAIREMVDMKIDSNESLLCITALMKTTYPGLAYLPGDCNNYSMKKENLIDLSKGIVEHFNSLDETTYRNHKSQPILAKQPILQHHAI